MRAAASFVGVDLGASSGRVIAGHWDGRQFQLEELHRFPNGGVSICDRTYWDVLGIWGQLQHGFSRFSAIHRKCPVSLGVDAWGIDFGLLDVKGRLISNPVHYRDRRTEGVPERLFEIIDEKTLFSETGVQSWRINTLFQLYSMVLAEDVELQFANTLLTIPDLFSYFLCGATAVEYTEATTMQMFSPRASDWARQVLRKIGIQDKILPRVSEPSARLGDTRSAVLKESGFSQTVPVIAVASHDTASAVAAIPNLDGDSAFISSGTWSLMGTEIPDPNVSDDARRLGFTNEGSATRGFLFLKNLAGLWIIQECLRCLEKAGRDYRWSEVIEAATAAPAFRSLLDPGDKMFELPADMPAAVQQYCSVTAQPIPQSMGEFARALFEGLALSYRMVLVSLEKLTGRSLTTIRIVGGGARNALLSQMVADACNRVVVAGPAEATVLGNVMIQAIATGHIGDLREGKIAVAKSCECQTYEPHHSATWDEAFVRFERLTNRHQAGCLA
jgi:sugar (pentulose or hexulose) kinase